MRKLLFLASLGIGLLIGAALRADDGEPSLSYPPSLKGAVRGTVIVTSPQFLEIPEKVRTLAEKPGAAPFDVARTPPTVRLAFHGNLGPDADKRRLWSSWGDIALASDGRVYCAIGDHGNDVGGDARCFVYRWDPKSQTLEQVVDMNQVVPPKTGQPAWSKVHAKVDEGTDGKIYFCCTLNDGNRAKLPSYGWNESLPGGQIYQLDPATGKTVAFANLPARRCTATSLLDRERNIWWCNLEAGEGNALWGFDLTSKKPVYQGADGSVGFNRTFGLLRDGTILFNGEASLQRLDPNTKEARKLKATFPDSPGMRTVSRQTSDGAVYGVTYKTNEVFRYDVAKDEVQMLGPSWLSGAYTTLMLVSPDERFLYYLPGAHGGAFKDGTPVIQYDLSHHRRKVLAFLVPVFEKEHDYAPAGTYGAKLSADGSRLYVNFNGHPTKNRPKHLRADGFGLCSFAEIEIPASER
ncbi:MAG: hypothetical protein IT428_32690 [Planctomycetaceae bacterium]|nr:hypothetical protein [Planctomycetaceae bacterium]